MQAGLCQAGDPRQRRKGQAALSQKEKVSRRGVLCKLMSASFLSLTWGVARPLRKCFSFSSISISRQSLTISSMTFVSTNAVQYYKTKIKGILHIISLLWDTFPSFQLTVVSLIHFLSVKCNQVYSHQPGSLVYSLCVNKSHHGRKQVASNTFESDVFCYLPSPGLHNTLRQHVSLLLGSWNFISLSGCCKDLLASFFHL